MSKPVTYRDGPRVPKSIEWYLTTCGVSDTPSTRKVLQLTFDAVAAAMNEVGCSRHDAEALVRRLTLGTGSAPEGACDRPVRKKH